MFPWKGPVTDYGATIVHWMRHRQPRYKGAFVGETERPSPSYIVDVSCSGSHLESWLTKTLDALPPCQVNNPGRLSAYTSLAFVPQQDQASYQCSAVDARRPEAVDCF